jgi:uncharacterized protein YigE (DUF2233 family)
MKLRPLALIGLTLTLLITPLTVCAEDAPRAAPAAKKEPRYHNVTLQGINVQCVSFDIRSHQLHVLDQPAGPGTLWPTSKEAAISIGGIAAINAGFFTPEGKALGVCIANGTRTGATHASSLGSGVWYEDKGRSSILRREKSNFRANHLLQAGPMLAEKAAPVHGLDTKRQSARCFIAWDGGSLWLIGRTSPCTLHALATAIAGASPAGFPIATALNLDGGRSAELYVSADIPGGGLTVRPFFNNPVRNFLVLKPR